MFSQEAYCLLGKANLVAEDECTGCMRDVNKVEFNRDFFVIEVSGQEHCENKVFVKARKRSLPFKLSQMERPYSFFNLGRM